MPCRRRPAWGSELDESILPAEAGLDETHISFTKGCYPGQEPIARLHYRGHANRGLRGLAFTDGTPEPGAVVTVEDRDVGRVTSVADSPRFGAIGLAVIRREIGDGDRVDAGVHAALVRPLPFA